MVATRWFKLTIQAITGCELLAELESEKDEMDWNPRPLFLSLLRKVKGNERRRSFASQLIGNRFQVSVLY